MNQLWVPIDEFFDTEWREAEEFAKMVSESINVDYIGDKTDT